MVATALAHVLYFIIFSVLFSGIIATFEFNGWYLFSVRKVPYPAHNINLTKLARLDLKHKQPEDAKLTYWR